MVERSAPSRGSSGQYGQPRWTDGPTGTAQADRLTVIQRSSVACAPPESMAARARSTPSASRSTGSPGSAACTASAAPALSSTASRTGPGSPRTSRRTTSALYDASRPRSASAVPPPSPTRAGSRTNCSTRPSVTAQTCEVVVVVSSSSPSSPRKTHASAPRLAKTPAISGAIRRSAQPIACAAGLAGWASGPRKLKVVAPPSSRRATAACRSAGWNAAAKQKVIPASSPILATAGAGRSRRIPRASSTSADPAFEDAERFPCLTTGAPAPAATIAAIVEMFTDMDRSPPVPTTSSTRPMTVRGVACAYMPSTRPSSSSMVSPLARSATANPAIWDGDASPARISPIAQDVWPLVRSAPPMSADSTSGQEWAVVIGGSAAGRRLGRRGPLPQQPYDRLGQLQRVEGMRHRAVGPGPRGEPGVLRATGEHQDRRTPVDLVLQLLGDAEAPGGGGLAVEDGQVDQPGVHLLQHDRFGGHLDVLELRHVGVRPATEPEDHLGAGVGVVAVDQDLQACVGCGVAHAADSTGHPRLRYGVSPAPRAGPGAGPRAQPHAWTSGPTDCTAHRRTPARPGRPRPRGCLRPGAGRPRGPAARTAAGRGTTSPR